MLCRITIRLVGRDLLDDVAARTQRTLVWLIGEAITDAAQAFALDQNALIHYVAAPAVGTYSRTTIAPSPATLAVLDSLHARTGLPRSVIARAAWSRWLALHSVDEIAAFCGGVRPSLEKESA